MSSESIQSMGGNARAAALSDDEKSSIARKAALARWAATGSTHTPIHEFSCPLAIGVKAKVWIEGDEITAAHIETLQKYLDIAKNALKL